MGKIYLVFICIENRVTYALLRSISRQLKIELLTVSFFLSIAIDSITILVLAWKAEPSVS